MERGVVEWAYLTLPCHTSHIIHRIKVYCENPYPKVVVYIWLQAVHFYLDIMHMKCDNCYVHHSQNPISLFSHIVTALLLESKQLENRAPVYTCNSEVLSQLSGDQKHSTNIQNIFPTNLHHRKLAVILPILQSH